MTQLSRHTLITLALVLLAPHASLVAQARAIEGNASPVSTITVPRNQRPRLAIRDFEFQAQISREDQSELNSYASVIHALRGGNPQRTAETNATNLARATSQLLTERLRNSGEFRVFERQQLGTVTDEQDLASSTRARPGQQSAQQKELVAASYVVTGAITKFGKSKKRRGGALGLLGAGIASAAHIESSKTEYEVGLTVKVIDSSTGEVVAAATTDGVVTGDTERRIAGLAGTWGAVAGGMFNSSATGEREKRISEALQRAIDLIVVQLSEARQRGDIAH